MVDEEDTTEDNEEETEEETDEDTGEDSERGETGSQEKKVSKRKTKARKVVRRRKSKKEKERPLAAAIRLAVESGKVEFGSRLALREDKPAKAFVVASNADSLRAELTAHSDKSATPIIEFEGTSIELGSICGKPFPVSILSVYDEGSSNILSLAKKK